jgi:hypothetical protein
MPRPKNKFSAAFTHEVEASKLYQDSIELRIRGAWRDAGDRLVKCALLYTHIKMMLEAACIYSEAYEAYMHVDKGEALLALQKAIKIYCDVGRFDIGGRLEQKVAYVNLRAQHWEDAALHFRKASNFLSGDKLLDQSDHCLEKCAECLIRMGDYKEASQLFQMVARSCVNSNLRRFNSLDHLLMAMLCLLAIPEAQRPTEAEIQAAAKQAQATSTPTQPKSFHDNEPDWNDNDEQEEEYVPMYQTKFEILSAANERMEKVDFLWRRSKEKLFMRNIIKARAELDLHAFADHLYYWSNVRPLNHNRTLLLSVPMKEIKEAIANAAAREAEEAQRLEAIRKKKAKKEAKRLNALAGNEGAEFESSRGSFNTAVGLQQMKDGKEVGPGKSSFRDENPT